MCHDFWPASRAVSNETVGDDAVSAAAADELSASGCPPGVEAERTAADDKAARGHAAQLLTDDAILDDNTATAKVADAYATSDGTAKAAATKARLWTI